MRSRHAVAAVLLAALAFGPPALAARLPVLSYDAMFAADAAGRAPSQLAWAPDGRHLTYVLDDGHGAVLWSLEPATGAARELLRPGDLAKAAGGASGGSGPSEDIALDAYQWSPRGDSLLLEAGGDLYLLSLAGNITPRRLTETAAAEKDPKFSPDATQIAFVRGADLYLLDVESGKEQALTADGKENEILNGVTDWLYWEEIWDRAATGFWWSPDSRHIAYYRFDERGVPAHPLVDETSLVPKLTWQKYPTPGDPNPKVRVGVLDLASGRTTWMETGDREQYLARVAWTPDGTAVAIEALNRAQNRLDLLHCDAEHGRCGTLLSETSATWVNLGDDFRFLPDGRFLWGSERSGWRRLYLYDGDGRLLRQVSPDGWVVSSVDRVPEAGDQAPWVLFTGYRTEPLLAATDRQIVEAPLLDGPFQVITVDPGTHAALVAPHTSHWVHTWSAANAPERAEVRLAPRGANLEGEQQRIVPLPFTPPSTFDPAALPQWEFLTIPGPGRTELPARLLKPPGFSPRRRYPVIFYQYGGPASQMVINRWDRGKRSLFHQRMAQLGFVVLTVDGRNTAFFGRAGEALDDRRMSEENLAAQLAAVEYLKTQGWADTDHLGLWGWSGGGTGTLYCMLRQPGVWKAGVAGAPVTDWRLYDSVYTERYLHLPADDEAGYRDSSPITYAKNLKDRLLIVHGLADDNVHTQNSVSMIDALVKAGKPVEQAFYPGEKHGMKPPSIRHFFERMEEFWVRALQGIESENVGAFSSPPYLPMRP